MPIHPSHPAALAATAFWLTVLTTAHAAEPTMLPPRLVQALAVQYPTAARESKAEGRVVIRLKVSADGSPELVRVYSSSGSKLLDDEALRAVSRARFLPGRVDERPTEMRLNLPVNFSLRTAAGTTRTTEPTIELRAKSPAAKDSQEPITVSITAQGQAYLEERALDLDALEDQLALRFSRTPNAAVHLRADRNASYQHVADVLAAVDNAGAMSVKFIVEAPR
jgi:TonB family protein